MIGRTFSRPRSRRDIVDRPANTLYDNLGPREVVMTIDELEATRRERFGHADDAAEERRRGIAIEFVCETCSEAIEQDDRGFWRHCDVNPACGVAKYSFRESRV